MTGVHYLTESDLRDLKVPSSTYLAIINDHAQFIDQCAHMDQAGYASTVKTALKFDKWHKLTMLSIHDCFVWYSLFRTQALMFGIPLQPFDVIELVYRKWGLCVPGIGLSRFPECGGLLMQILEQVPPMSESRIAGIADINHSSAVDGVGANGFAFLFRIMRDRQPSHF